MILNPSKIYLQVFDYIEPLDCFVISKDFAEAANALGLNEWHEAVWIGRYFMLDNDNGEHWFDNWPERDSIEKAAKALGYESHFLMVIDPERFMNGKDGPCHSKEERKQFWHDVLIHLKLSLQTIFNEARKFLRESSSVDEPEEGEIQHTEGSLSETESAFLQKYTLQQDDFELGAGNM